VTAVDYADFGAPQGIATSVAGTGVPLLTLPTLVTSGTAVINAGSQILATAVSVNQPSYEVVLTPFESGAGAAAGLEVAMIWRDSTGTVIVGRENYWVWPGVTSGAHVIFGHGACKGGNLQMVMTNNSTVMQYTVNYSIYARSNIYSRDDWRSEAYSSSASAQPLAASDVSALQIGAISASVPAATNNVYELPLFTGPAFLHAETSSNTTDMLVAIQNSTDPNGLPLNSNLFKMLSDVAGLVSAAVVLPRYQCRLVLGNNNAAAKTLQFSLIYQDGAS
jgi:hypothetical protein